MIKRLCFGKKKKEEFSDELYPLLDFPSKLMVL